MSLLGRLCAALPKQETHDIQFSEIHNVVVRHRTQALWSLSTESSLQSVTNFTPSGWRLFEQCAARSDGVEPRSL